MLVAENAILITYYQHTANTTALHESIDEPTGRPADNPPNEDRLGVLLEMGPGNPRAVRVWTRKTVRFGS